MPATAEDRSRLYTDLERALGAQSAETLMSFLPSGPVEDRLTRVEDRLTEVEGRLTRVEDRLTDVDGRLTRVEDRLTEVDGRLTRVEDRLTEVEKGVVDLRARVDGLDARLTGFEGAMTKEFDRVFGILRTNTVALIGGFAAIVAAMITSGFFD